MPIRSARPLIAVLALFCWVPPAFAQLEATWHSHLIREGVLHPTADDGFLLAGTFRDSLDVDGDGVIDADSIGGTDAFLARFDAAGELTWVTSAGGMLPSERGSPAHGSPLLATDQGLATTEDENGNVYLSGRFRSSIDFDGDAIPELTSTDTLTAFVAQYNAMGDFNWALQLPVHKSEAHRLAINSTHQALYVLGYGQGLTDDGPATNKAPPGDAFFARVSSAGELEWIRMTNTNEGNPFFPILLTFPTTDANGNLYVPGGFLGTVDLDGDDPLDPFINPSFVTQQGFLLKLTPDGAIPWIRSLFSMEGSSWKGAVTQDSSLFLHGSKGSGEAFLQSTNTTMTLLSAGTQAIVARYDLNGALDWGLSTQAADGSTLSVVQGNSLALDVDQRLWLAGSLVGSIDFDNDFAAERTSTNTIPFLAAYDTDGLLLAASSPATEQNSAGSFWSSVMPLSDGLLVAGQLDGEFDLDGPGLSPVISLDSSQFVITRYRFTGDPLPVSLTSLHGTTDGQRIFLSWETASETNNAGFEVEARTGSAAFTSVGFVEGSGTVSSPSTYRFEYVPEQPGRYLFRLKQVDFDGSASYSEVVEVLVTSAHPFVLSDVYPNPFNPTTQFTLSVIRTQVVTINLYDSLGREVMKLYDGVLPAGITETITIEASHLPSGVYWIRATGAHFHANKQVVLAK